MIFTGLLNVKSSIVNYGRPLFILNLIIIIGPLHSSLF